MVDNKLNFQKDINLLIQNIDTTSERLSSDNKPGIFLKSKKELLKPYKAHINKNNKEKKIQKYSDNLIPSIISNIPNKYNYNKDYYSSQKETQDMIHKKNNIITKNNNPQKSKNYNNIVKNINNISSENSKKILKKNKIPLRPRKNISKISDNENKDSYTYLIKLKKNYSIDKLKNENLIYTNDHTNNKSNNFRKSNGKKAIKKNLTLNNFYKTPHLQNISFINNSKKITSISPKNNPFIYNDINQSNKKKNRNISFYKFNRLNLINNNINSFNISDIINVRKKYNETCNHFYHNNNKNSNKKLIRNLTENNSFKKLKHIIQKSNNNPYHTSDYSSINLYWNKRSQDTFQKISQIKNELIKKEENEIHLIPKISEKSKELAINSDKYNIKFNNIYERLFYINNLNFNIDDKNNIKNNTNNNIQYHPLINEKSKKMNRTIDDLYSWQNKKEKKIKENTENILKKIIFNKQNTNLTSEVILKDRRPNYINKKVEDRLIEQGKNQKIKQEIEKEKNFHQLTDHITYVNNNYNNIKSRYLKEKNNNQDIEKNNLYSIENIQSNYFNIANMRNYDNFNKKLIYYGDKLNQNSFYYYHKINKSLNSNQKSLYSKSSDKIKCFDDNYYQGNIDINKKINFNYNKDNNIKNIDKKNNLFISRIPQDFNKISRPQTSKNNENQIKFNIGTKFDISNLSNHQTALDNNLSNKNSITENINNNIKENKNNKQSYYSLLYNDMINYNSKLTSEVNNVANNKINHYGNLEINLNINNTNKNESAINSYRSNLININREKNNINQAQEALIDNYNINNNKDKFNIKQYYQVKNNILNNNNEIGINMNKKENKNLDSDIIDIKEFNNNYKNNNNDYRNNEIINQITSSISSSNTSKIERRDRRKEDLKKIINFSDNLYNSRTNKNCQNLEFN